MGRVIRRIKSQWNLFRDTPQDISRGGGYTQSPRSARSPTRYYSDRSFIGSIYNRMAVDFSQVDFMHCMLDEKDDIAVSIVRDALHWRLTLDPNIDQTAQALKIDYAFTMFEHGHACLVPVEANTDPNQTGAYDIGQIRVATVAAWHPQYVTLNVYDDRDVDDEGEPINGGIIKQMTVHKSLVVIQENPFYTTMNEPNGLLQRLIAKLALMDQLDEAAGSGKLDMLLQLPFPTRTDSRKAEAEGRRQALREQLKDDELGIGYIDISEKVIQLNRPVVNKLLEEIEYLANAVLSELGLTREIMNGTANQDTINNYFDRTIEPIANGAAQEIKRKWLTKTAISQRHSVEIYRDPLKLIPMSELAEIVDKLRRNAVVTANEIRPKIGYMPLDKEEANELGNPNMPADDQVAGPAPEINGVIPKKKIPAPRKEDVDVS